MLDCLIPQSRDTASGLLKNYLDGADHISAQWAFGDAAGTALVTSAVYRLAVLYPEHFCQSAYLLWAQSDLDAVVRQIDDHGRVRSVPSVDGVPSKYAAQQTSEGQSMVILMYAAWRDCVKAGVCEFSRWRRLGGAFSTFVAYY